MSTLIPFLLACVSPTTARGYSTKILTAGDASASLISDGEYAYEGLFLLCPTATKSARSLQPADVSAFVSSGRSVFVAAAPEPSAYTKSVAAALGVVIHPSQTIDHQHAVAARDVTISSGGTHTYITAGGRDEAAKAVWAADLAAAAAAAADVHFVGPAATLSADNELVSPVLWAADAAYAGTPGARVTKAPVATGRELVLAATLSARRSGGRAVYWGSVDTLSDAAAAAAPSGHAATTRALAAWALGERGVLRSRGVSTALVGRPPVVGEEAATYRVRDDVAFGVTLEEWDCATARWVPYVATDVQVELVMLNPYVRTRLASVAGEPGRYTATLRVPDVIGIYSFRVAYYRPGLTPVDVTEVVSVRPFLHNEFERFIPQAYPYYAGAFSMLMGALMLTGVLLQS